MLLPFNTSVFSNILGAPDRAAQRKAIVAPFDEFDAKPEDVTCEYTLRIYSKCTYVVEFK